MPVSDCCGCLHCRVTSKCSRAGRREILYRLLQGEQGMRMQIACAASRLHDVNRAVSWIKRNFHSALSVETLASEARMSTSGAASVF